MADLRSIITARNEVCEGYVFIPVCQSFCSQGGVCGRGGACMAGGVHGRGSCVVGGMHGRGACIRPQHYDIRSVNAGPVHILLECILVLDGHPLSDNFFPVLMQFLEKKIYWIIGWCPAPHWESLDLSLPFLQSFKFIIGYFINIIGSEQNFITILGLKKSGSQVQNCLNSFVQWKLL